MFFRRGRSSHRWLQARIWTFTIGAVLALTGMILTNDWIIAAAALVLAAGIALRFAAREPHGDAEPGADAADAPEESTGRTG